MLTGESHYKFRSCSRTIHGWKSPFYTNLPWVLAALGSKPRDICRQIRVPGEMFNHKINKSTHPRGQLFAAGVVNEELNILRHAIGQKHFELTVAQQW